LNWQSIELHLKYSYIKTFTQWKEQRFCISFWIHHEVLKLTSYFKPISAVILNLKSFKHICLIIEITNYLPLSTVFCGGSRVHKI